MSDSTSRAVIELPQKHPECFRRAVKLASAHTQHEQERTMRGVNGVDLVRSLRGSSGKLKVVFDRYHNVFGVCHEVLV